MSQGLAACQARGFDKAEHGQLESRAVESPNGREIGEIEDVAIVVDDQKPYAVIGVCSTLGSAGRRRQY